MSILETPKETSPYTLSEEARELYFYVETNAIIYPEKKAAIARLCRHIARGDYDQRLAEKALYTLATSAAMKYAREHCSPDQKYHQIFSVSDRQEAARRFREEFEIEYDCNQWDGINPIAHKARPKTWRG